VFRELFLINYNWLFSDYFSFSVLFFSFRVIIVIQLEILHAECTLIRSPTIFEANATQHIGVSCSGGLAIHEPCFMPCTQQVISNSSCSPDKRVDSSVTPKAEPTVINLPFSECVCSMPAQSTVDAKMQQLSLNDHQNQRVMMTATGDALTLLEILMQAQC
jgi:replication factor A1